MVNIDLSPKRLTPDALVIWQAQTPETNLTMDLKALTLRPDSVDQIIAYHVMDQLFHDEAIEALRNWQTCLKKGGKLYLVTDDFEYIARAFVGGDIDIGIFNRNHSHASQWDRQSLGEAILSLNFPEPTTKIWFDHVPNVLQKNHYELIMETIK